MSARFTAVWSWAPELSTASNSELSITPWTVRLRVSSGFCSTAAFSSESAPRETLRVWVSFRRRSRPYSEPSLCVTRSASPGRSESRASRTPGRLRIDARSERSSFRRRKMRSSVSLRATTMSMRDRAAWASARGEAAASCSFSTGALAAAGAAAAVVATAVFAAGGAISTLPCIRHQPTTAQALACSQKVGWGQRTQAGSLLAGLGLWSIDYTCPCDLKREPYRARSRGSMYVKCRNARE